MSKKVNNVSIESLLTEIFSDETGSKALTEDKGTHTLSPAELNETFSYLNIDFTNKAYSNLQLTPEQAQKIRRSTTSLRTGTYASVPLTCAGPEKCPIFSFCWFAKYDEEGLLDPDVVYPLLQPCPVEISVIKIKVESYIKQYLDSVFTTDKSQVSASTMSLLTKLAELDIYENRCNMTLSSGDRKGEGRDLLSSTVEAIHEGTGEIIWGVKEHPILEIKRKIQKERENILKLLIATPESQINMKHKYKELEKEETLSKRLLNISRMLTIHDAPEED